MAKTENPRDGSQSRIPSLFLWAVLAAVVFRIVTGLADKEGAEKRSWVRWASIENAPRLAAARGKPILYDFTAEWCSPCHLLDREGWGHRETALFVNNAYVPVRVLDRMREEGKNSPSIEDLERRFAVNVFPTLIVADAAGNLISKQEGYRGRGALETFLRNSRRGETHEGPGLHMRFSIGHTPTPAPTAPVAPR